MIDRHVMSAEDVNRPLVLLVAYRDSRSAGGSLRVLETLAKTLPSRGYDVEIVFAYGNAGPVSDACKCPIHCLNARHAYGPMSWLRARRFDSFPTAITDSIC